MGRTPSLAVTSPSQAPTHACRSLTDSPPVCSRSRAGTRSPGRSAALLTNQSAWTIASPGVLDGSAKWYAVTRVPAARALAWFVAYIGSRHVSPSVACTIAKRLPAAATLGQSMAPW